jgi:hypothetical protein
MAVDELNINSLVLQIENYLIKDESDFLFQNPVEILETAYQHKLFKNLLNAYLEKICEEPEKLFNSDNFINLKAPLLKLLLKRDDLDLDEIDIWNNLLKWGFAQNPSISQDVTKWNKEEITIMEKTLCKIISLIRFYYISPENFIDKVYPLRDLLPKDLVDNLLAFHIVPNRNPNIDVNPRHHKIDSVIVQSKKIFAIFASWIDKKEDLHYNGKNIPYNFKLLYRASKDGYTAEEFHANCDDKDATIVVAKITNSEQIFGGYNPLSWDLSGEYKSTNDSFIFSFTNRTNLQTSKVAYCNDNQYSIYCGSEYGPAFGGGHDLYCQDDNWYFSNPYSYSDIDIPRNTRDDDDYYVITVDDYEVFQVVKK